MENLDRNILIPNNWDLKAAGISKIGIKQHLLIEHVHGTSFVAMVTHRCKQQVGTCDTNMALLQLTTKKIEGCKVGLKNMHFIL